MHQTWQPCTFLHAHMACAKLIQLTSCASLGLKILLEALLSGKQSGVVVPAHSKTNKKLPFGICAVNLALNEAGPRLICYQIYCQDLNGHTHLLSLSLEFQKRIISLHS